MINLGNSSAPQANAGGVINLSKGAKISLAKVAPAMHKCLIGLGWKTMNFDGSGDMDLDAAAFMVGSNGRCSEDGFIFYNHLEDMAGSVRHHGDDLVGGSGGDDEQISIDLDKVPANIDKIAITVTIFDPDNAKHQNFGMVDSAFVRIVNEDTGAEVIRYDLREDFSTEQAVTFIELYRHNGEWKVDAVGSGFEGGLLKMCQHYGLNASY